MTQSLRRRADDVAVDLSAEARIALSAAAQGKLTWSDGRWRCGKRTFDTRTIHRLIAEGNLAPPTTTPAGAEVLRRPPVNLNNEATKRRWRDGKAGAP